MFAAALMCAQPSAALANDRSSGFLAFFPPASHPHWEGFARIINHSGTSGTAYITGIDDAGNESGPVELSLTAHASAHFNSTDLEGGNPDKGLSRGLGDGEGDWRLQFESDLDIELLPYARTHDGFVTPMHDLVPVEGMRHHVRFFNPGSNRAQVSRLRLINPTGDRNEVTVEGRDDEGNDAPGGTVGLTPAESAVRELLESQPRSRILDDQRRRVVPPKLRRNLERDARRIRRGHPKEDMELVELMRRLETTGGLTARDDD